VSAAPDFSLVIPTYRRRASLQRVLAGLAVVRHPLWATIMIPSMLAWLLGAFGIVIGIVTLFRAVTGAGWGAAIIGVISVLLGVILLLNPVFTASVLVYAAAACAVAGGVVSIVYAFRLRSLGPGARRSGLKLVNTAPTDN